MKRCLLVGAAPSTGQGLTYILKTQSFDAVYGIKIKDATVGHVNQNIGKLSMQYLVILIHLAPLPAIQKFTNTILIKISPTWILQFITPLRKVMRN